MQELTSILSQTQIMPVDIKPLTPVEVLTKEVFKPSPKPKFENLKISEVKKLTDNLNKIMDAFDVQARFSIHDKTKDIMVKILNTKTNEIIREIPVEKMVDMIAKMMEMIGMLIDEKA